MRGGEYRQREAWHRPGEVIGNKGKAREIIGDEGRLRYIFFYERERERERETKSDTQGLTNISPALIINAQG